MKIKKTFTKTKLGKQTYVLPFGQSIASHCRGISLNEAGETLWDGMKKGYQKEELLCLLKQEYILENDANEELMKDITNFQKNLLAIGITETEENKDYGWIPLSFSIGPLNITYKGPQILYNKYFIQFQNNEIKQADLTVQISCLPPRNLKNGTVLVRNDELFLMETDEEYLFLFPKFSVLSEMHVKKNGSRAVVFCNGNFIEKQMEDIFHAIRFAVLIAAGKKGLFFLHSASLLYQGKAWLFSGKSGTGKSTHTNLWKENFQTELINGDLNMIGIESDTAYVFGQPWCGTSEICTEKNYPIGGIIFLKQAKENICEIPDTAEKLLAIIQRLISPAWDETLLERNIFFAEQLEKLCPIWQLLCTPEKEAAVVMKKEIDQFLR